MTIQGTIDEIQFRHGEQESIRVQKLALVLTKLLEALGVTTDDAIAAIAALTPAADRYIYFTGATTASLGTITAFARTILDDADAATVRTTIGAEPTITAGTTAQYWRGDKSWQTLNGAAVANTPAGNIAATTVQAAIDELDSEKLASSAYTAADVLSKLLTVDGPGSGLNADFLDDESRDFYLDRGNHTDFQAASTISDFSAASDARIAAAVGVSVQAFDADLSALAALSGTNTIYYRSAANTWTAVTIGSLLSFSGGTLNIGDAELTAIAGLTSAADRLPYFTGSGTAALATFTASGRTVAAASGTTGTGSVVFSANPTFTGTAAFEALATSGNTTLGDATSDGHVISGGITLNTGPSNGILGQVSGVSTWALFGTASTLSVYADEILLRSFGGTVRTTINSTGVDMLGEARCDTLRIDATATAGVVAGTHTVPVNINGTAARMIVAIP